MERWGASLTVMGNACSICHNDVGDKTKERRENDGHVSDVCGGGEAVAALGTLMSIVISSLSKTRLTAAFWWSSSSLMELGYVRSAKSWKRPTKEDGLVLTVTYQHISFYHCRQCCPCDTMHQTVTLTYLRSLLRPGGILAYWALTDTEKQWNVKPCSRSGQ